MSTYRRLTDALAADRPRGRADGATLARARRRALIVTTGITIVSFGLLIDLLLVRHTTGEEIWGPITAAIAATTGVLSLVVLARRGRSRAARWGLIALWLTVAFFGFGGYNSHRLPRPADTATDQRPRPPLAPLAFTGLGIAGAVVLRSGTKGS